VISARSPRVRRLALTALWTLAATTRPASAAAQAPAGSRPNVIVFVADDLGWRDTGIYGTVGIRTPNIDRLARSGLRVERAFGTSPQCSPSRISILTGKYSHSTGTKDLHTPLPEAERILPFSLQARGYFTGHMAKTHYGPAADRQFRWYSPETAEVFPDFLGAAGARRSSSGSGSTSRTGRTRASGRAIRTLRPA
jgi:N-sulfoglucosamine sulfohydrolase